MFDNKENYNILIVEDEIITIEFIKQVLFSLGFINIYSSNNSKNAIDIVKKYKIDCAFMDINIKGSIDGISCAKIINQSYSIPIIYTTAYQDTDTMVEANETNISSYLIKPFYAKDIEINVYIALNKHLKKSKVKKNITDIKNLGNGYTYNYKEKKLYLQNKYQELTLKEKDILHILYKNLNNSLTFSMFRTSVWKDKSVSDNTIRDTIFRVRKKAPLLNIKSISGIGYMLKSDEYI